MKKNLLLLSVAALTLNGAVFANDADQEKKIVTEDSLIARCKGCKKATPNDDSTSPVQSLEDEETRNSLIAADDEEVITDSLFAADDEEVITDSLFAADDEEVITDSLFAADDEEVIADSLFAADADELEDEKVASLV